MKLNVDPEQRKEVERKLAAREEVLNPLRESFYRQDYQLRTTEAGKYIRDKCEEIGPIGGCYLPNREELEQQAIDKGYSEPDSHYEDNIFKNPKGYYWSSSGWPDTGIKDGLGTSAFAIDAKFGNFGNLNVELNKTPVRCVCSGSPR